LNIPYFNLHWNSTIIYPFYWELEKYLTIFNKSKESIITQYRAIMTNPTTPIDFEDVLSSAAHVLVRRNFVVILLSTSRNFLRVSIVLKFRLVEFCCKTQRQWLVQFPVIFCCWLSGSVSFKISDRRQTSSKMTNICYLC
jgi:hypothetical protein